MTYKEYFDAERPTDEIAYAIHREYFGQYVTEYMKEAVVNFIGKDLILQSQDIHLNDIPLKKWDDFTKIIDSNSLRSKLRANGDTVPLAVLVCIAKEAAKQFREDYLKVSEKNT